MLSGYLAARAGLVVQGIGILNIRRLTGPANGQVQLVVSGNVLQQIPGPLEAEFRNPVQQYIGFKGTAYAVAVFNVRAGPAGMNPVGGIDSEQEACAIERNQRRGLQLIVCIFDEKAYLLRRLSAATPDRARAAVAEICRIEFAYPVVTQPGALLDSACSGLVPNHAKRKFKLISFSRVAVVGKAHLFLFMLVIDYIQWYKSLYHLYMVNQSKKA